MRKRSCSHENHEIYSNITSLLSLATISISYLFTIFFHFNIEGNQPPLPQFFSFSNSSLPFLYPLLPLFTGLIKGTEALVKQSNKMVMECTTVPTYGLNAHSFSWCKSLFL